MNTRVTTLQSESFSNRSLIGESGGAGGAGGNEPFIVLISKTLCICIEMPRAFENVDTQLMRNHNGESKDESIFS